MITPHPIDDAPLPDNACEACGGTGRLPDEPYINDWWADDVSNVARTRARPTTRRDRMERPGSVALACCAGLALVLLTAARRTWSR